MAPVELLSQLEMTKGILETKCQVEKIKLTKLCPDKSSILCQPVFLMGVF